MNTNENNSLGFIGCGNMGASIARALFASGYSLFAFDVNSTSIKGLNGIVNFENERCAVLNKAKYIFISVKPQNFEVALEGLDFAPHHVLVSIMAGVNLKRIKAVCGAKKVVRVMPNLNAEVFNSYNPYCSIGLSKEDKSEVNKILSSFGVSQEISEKHMAAVTGISGGGPAYVCRFLTGLVEATREEGLTPTQAMQMSLSLLLGTSRLVSSKVAHKMGDGEVLDYPTLTKILTDIPGSVCSKGGTTIEGIMHLDTHSFSGLVKDAALKAAKRAKQLEV